MFVVIYSFKTLPDKESEFVHSWKELTKLIYQFENSFGSRLHKKEEGHYIAYAQWPDRETWANSGNNLPKIAARFRNQMKDACSEMITQHELELMSDLLRNSTIGS